MSDKMKNPLAMPSPATQVTAISRALLSAGQSASRASPRGRIIQPLHKAGGDLLQRMLNSVQPGSYIRPHRHAAERAESMIVLTGSILCFTFNDDGSVEQAFTLKAESDRFGIDIGGGVWHSFIALVPDTTLFEVKPGPYNAETDKEFAPWAPKEYSAEATPYLEALRQYATTSL